MDIPFKNVTVKLRENLRDRPSPYLGLSSNIQFTKCSYLSWRSKGLIPFFALSDDRYWAPEYVVENSKSILVCAGSQSHAGWMFMLPCRGSVKGLEAETIWVTIPSDHLLSILLKPEDLCLLGETKVSRFTCPFGSHTTCFGCKCISVELKFGSPVIYSQHL